VRKFLLLIVTAVLCALIVAWKLCGITGNEMLFSLIAIWAFPISTAFSAGLTLYRCKLNIAVLITAVGSTIFFPLWCFGTYQLIPTALVVFFAVMGAAVSEIFKRMKR